MDMRRGRKISAAGHQSDPLERIIYRDGEVIARRHIFAGENDIAKERGLCRAPPRPVSTILEPV
jgi:hypothetical protein